MTVPSKTKTAACPTDEAVDVFYSCAVCQSVSPGHLCVISPERPGQCGVYTWQSCRAGHAANPIGPWQSVPKGQTLNRRLGRWRGVDEAIFKASGGKTSRVALYSLIKNPVTTCNQCEAIAVVLPRCNGFMTVSVDYDGPTPSGMTFQEIRRHIGGGGSTPGFAGHSKSLITGRKYFPSEGGLLRLVWMPKKLKEELGESLRERAAELCVPDLVERIADETTGVAEEAILPFLREKRHPALEMGAIL